MKIWAVTMVRDEEDVIVPTCRHLLAQGVDQIVVADNLSRDRTRARLDRLASQQPITVIDDLDPAYRQSEKMTRLAQMAGEAGADWIIPFDADELWLAPRFASLRAAILAATGNALRAPVYNYRPSLIPGRNPFDRMQWRRPHHEMLGKVAFRYQPDLIIEIGNHGVSGRNALNIEEGLIEVRHYPYRNYRQFRRKVRQGTAAADQARLGSALAAHWRHYASRNDMLLALTWVKLCSERGLVKDPIVDSCDHKNPDA